MFITGLEPSNNRYRFMSAYHLPETLLEDFALLSLTLQATRLIHQLVYVPISSPVLPVTSSTTQETFH